jgi:hypothetical protein
MAIKVKAGNGEIVARPFWDSTPAFASKNYETLRTRLAKDGYLFLHGVLPSEDVSKVRCHSKYEVQSLLLLTSLNSSFFMVSGSGSLNRLKKRSPMSDIQVSTASSAAGPHSNFNI